jgi:hypothetical protein
MCPSCSGDPRCDTIADFIERLAGEDQELDVFMEFPYVVASGNARESMIQHLDNLFSKEKQNLTEKVMTKIFGNTKEYIGVFSLLYDRFSKKMYRRHPQGRHESRQRFHYADARFEINVKRFLAPTDDSWIRKFHECIPDIPTFRHLLECFVVGHKKRAFQVEMRDLFGSWIDVYEESLSSKSSKGQKTLHKISKQVHKLPASLRKLVEDFINEKLDAICNILKVDLRYEDGKRFMFKKPTPEELNDGTLIVIRASRLANYVKIFQWFMNLIVQTIMIDVYLLSRMLFYSMKKSKDQKTSVIYAGDYHISVYADFFRRFLGIEPNSCHLQTFPARFSDEQIQSMVKRCVHMNKNACPLLSSKPRRKSEEARTSG